MSSDKFEIGVGLDTSELSKSADKFKKQGIKAGDNFALGFRKKLNSTLGNIVGFTALSLGVKKVVSNLIEFDAALAEVSTITQGLGINQEELKNKLIETSAQFGTSAREQANSYYQIISAGITDAKQANDALIAANKLAIGGLTSTSGAIDLLTSAVNAYGSENLSASKAADIIFTTVKLGKTRVEELQSSLGQILPSAKAIGVSFEDVSAGLAQLTTKGVSTSEAVTQLNAVFTAVLKKQDTAKKLGKDVAKAFSLQALQTKGLTKFLKDLNKSLGGSEEKLVKLLGRAEGARAIMSLASDGFNGMTQKVRELTNASGAADDAFKKMSETLGFKLSQAGSKISAIFLSLSGQVQGPFSGAIDFLNRQLDDLLIAFNSFSSIGDIVSSSLKVLAISIIEFGKTITESLFNIPLIGDKLKESFGDDVISFFDNQILKLEQSVLNVMKPSTVALASENSKQAGVEVGKSFVKGVSDGINSLNEPITLSLQNLSNSFLRYAQTVKVTSKQVSTSLVNGMAAGASNAFGAMGKAVASGKNAFEAFGKSVLSSLGQMLMQLGQSFILQGIAHSANPLTPGIGGPMIAAGAALSLFGGLLSGAGGGAQSIGTGSTPVSDFNEPISGALDQTELDSIEKNQAVTVNVEGTVLDPQSVGLQIADVLNEAGFGSGAVLAS